MATETFSHKEIEPKWQQIWQDTKAFQALEDHSLPKYYCLIEFPYPSGEGLHVGHPRPYTALDIIARKRRLEGYNVLFPIGWDAFGLPTENYAIKTGQHPAVVTRKNIDRFRKQCQSLGFSFDYSREVDTTDPGYYKFTQWIFLKLFEKGLAYKTEMPINFCTSCKVGLANEEVVGGTCERCGGEVIRKVKSQWMLKITAYAEKLLQGLDTVDFIEKVKVQQRNWIGRSEGAEVDFTLAGSGNKITVFTTRPDTLFGATYMVLSPEHPLVETLKEQIENFAEVEAYREAASRKSDFERTESEDKGKTGVPLRGIKAINPCNKEEIPVWISDYVLTGYGTGAIMAVPAHDERDYAFARAFSLPIREVVAGGDVSQQAYTNTETGLLVNSGFLNGLPVPEAKEKMLTFLEENALGRRKVNYRLRDWVFSRQRYWGEPVPLVNCPCCGWVPVPESELPLTLPPLPEYKAGGEESPLALLDWANTTCPRCGGPARRETDVMPQWAGSSWYFLRYTDPHNKSKLAGWAEMVYWLPVDWYNGGMEHTTLHLLYSRFWHLFLYDIGVVPTPEPYQKRTSHGMILGETGDKMSKSRGNVVNPDDIVAEMGADALRVYEMFMGAFDQAIPWSTDGARGCRRFLDRVWRLHTLLVPGEIRPSMLPSVHAAIRKVGEDYERTKFNTAIAALMTLTNELYASNAVTAAELRTLLVLLNPVAPHMTEELWQQCGFAGYVFSQAWPAYDETLLTKTEVEIALQVCGKLRGRMTLPAGLKAPEAEALAMENEAVQKLLLGRTVKKVIVVPDKLINFVAF